MINDIDCVVDQILWLQDKGFKIGDTVTMYPTNTNGLAMPCDYYILGYSITSIGFRIDLYIVKKQCNVSTEFCASIDMFNDSIFKK